MIGQRPAQTSTDGGSRALAPRARTWRSASRSLRRGQRRMRWARTVACRAVA